MAAASLGTRRSQGASREEGKEEQLCKDRSRSPIENASFKLECD